MIIDVINNKGGTGKRHPPLKPVIRALVAGVMASGIEEEIAGTIQKRLQG